MPLKRYRDRQRINQASISSSIPVGYGKVMFDIYLVARNSRRSVVTISMSDEER